MAPIISVRTSVGTCSAGLTWHQLSRPFRTIGRR